MATSISDIILRAVGDVDDAEQDLDSLAARLNALDAKEAEAEFRLDADRARAQIADAHRQLRDLDRTTATPDVKLRSLDLFMELEALEVKLAELDHTNTTIDIRVRRGILDDLRRVTDEIGDLTGGGAGGGGGDGGGSFLDAFGRRIGLVLRLLPALIPLIVTLGGALVGLGGSALTAAAGLGAVGIAGGALLGPLVAIGIGAVAAFTSATKAAEDLETATEQLEAAEEAHAQAARGVADAERAVADAQRGAQRAQDALRQAREDARAQAEAAVAAALDRVRAAEDALTAAQIEQTSATLALADAREQARRELEALQIQERSDKLGVKDARDALSDARRDLDDLRRSGASQEEISDARRRVQRAEIDLDAARARAKNTTEDLNEAERKGVEGSDAVVAAKQRIAEANDRIADATEEIAEGQRELLDAQDAEIRKAPGVVSARQALADAHRGVRDALRGVDDAERRAASSARDLAEAQKAVAEANAALAAAGPRSALALKDAASDFAAAFRAMTRAGADAIFRSLISALRTLRPLMAGLEPAFTRLGEAIGGAFERWASELASPEWAAFFEMITDAAARIVPVLTEAFISLANVLRDIATAALPFFERGIGRFAEWSRRVERATGNADALGDTIEGMVSVLDTWWRLLGSIGGALVQIFRGANEPVQTFLDRMTAAIDRWAEWAATTEGQNSIREFFETILPTTERLLRLVVRLVDLFIRWTELMAPLWNAALDVLNPIIELLSKVLDLIDLLPDGIDAVLTAWLGWKAARGVFGMIISNLKRIFGFPTTVPTPTPTPTPAPTGGGGVLGSVKKWAGRLIPPAAAFAAGYAIGEEYFDGVDSWFEKNVRRQNEMGESWSEQIVAGVRDELNRAIPAVFAALPRRIRRAVDKAGGLREAFTDEQILELGKVVGEGGNIAGHEYVRNFASKVRQRRRLLDDAVNFVTGQSARQIDPKPFETAGEKIGGAVARGVRRAASAIGEAMRKVAKGIRDVFPGSEPKDPRSPLRNLSRAGAATIDNYLRGVAARRGSVSKALADALAGLPIVGRGRWKPELGPWMLPDGYPIPGGGGGSGGLTMHNHFSVPGNASAPDPDAAVAAISRRLRARGVRLAP